MNILITGTAGFIGSKLANILLEDGFRIIGIDSHNDYYDPKIKEARIQKILNHKNYVHYRIDICNRNALDDIFNIEKPVKVVNLAAQAGVRYSIENPKAYIDSNIVGFLNILENCRNHNIEHLVFASSSSVYGANKKMPFSENDSTNHPLALYGATKKSNELMAHAYSSLYGIPSTGLRFFTVYGPWGRPDMALFKFTEKILKSEEIEVYNYGNHTRDFTYIDDIVYGITQILNKSPELNLKWNAKNPDPGSSRAPWKIYNIGNSQPVKLLDYISALENALGKKAKIKFLPLQPGDVPDTYSNMNNLEKDFNWKPKTTVKEGIGKFVEWYLSYYK